MKTKNLLLVAILLIIVASARAGTVYTFQEGLDGYAGTSDIFVSGLYPNAPSPEYPLMILVDGGVGGDGEDHRLLQGREGSKE